MRVDIELYRRDAQIAPGLRLSVIDIAPEAPARTMVFIHGFGGKASRRFQPDDALRGNQPAKPSVFALS